MTDEVGSPRWWLQRLSAKLQNAQPGFKKYNDYFRGDHPLLFLPKETQTRYLKEYKRMMERARSNFTALVVEAVAERLEVQGFRLSGSEDVHADQRSWEIWQANHLDADSVVLFEEALVKGCGYLSVWEPQRGSDFPTIAIESPAETIVEHVPGRRWDRAAALKTWMDDQRSEERANVYLPDRIVKFRRRRGDAAASYGWRELDGDEGEIPNRFGVVPIIPLYNRPALGRLGDSEIAGITDIQDRINETLFNRALAGWFTAFRQKWATGLDVPEDPETGQPLEKFQVAMDRLLWSSDNETKFGEFGATDLGPYIKAVEQDVMHIVAISRTPRHYLIQEGQSPSGDALRSAEAGLTKKVHRKGIVFGESIEEAMRLARRVDQEFNDREAPPDSEVIWADPESYTEGERTDAIIKLVKTGLIGRRTALEKLGYTPQEIARIETDLTRAELMDAALGTVAGDDTAAPEV